MRSVSINIIIENAPSLSMSMVICSHSVCHECIVLCGIWCVNCSDVPSSPPASSRSSSVYKTARIDAYRSSQRSNSQSNDDLSDSSSNNNDNFYDAEEWTR